MDIRDVPAIRYLWAMVMMPIFVGGGLLLIAGVVAIMMWPYWLYLGVCAVTGWC